MHSTITSLFFLSCFLIFSSDAQATGPAGACLRGQNDAGFTYKPSDYTPVVYEFASTSPKTPNSGEPLTFFSWNIQSGYEYDCKQVLATQIAFMAAAKADFIGLQETDINVDIRCGCHMPQLVANGVGYKTHFMQMFPWRTGKYGHMEAFGYTAEYTTYLYYTVVSGFERRGALATLVSPPQLNGHKMWFVNTHMEQSSGDVRMGQVTELKNWVQNTLLAKEPNAVVVMSGDYYTVPGDATYVSMSQMFKNAWEVFNGSPNGGYTHVSAFPTERLDHFWYKDSASVKTTVTSFTIPTETLSDHLAIIAKMTFSTSGSPTTGNSSATTASSSATTASSSATTASSSATTASSSATTASSSATTASSSATTASSSATTASTSPGTTGAPPATTGTPNMCGFAITLTIINAWNSSGMSNVQYRMGGRNIGAKPLSTFKFKLTVSHDSCTVPYFSRWNFMEDTPLSNRALTAHANLWNLPGLSYGGDTGFVVATPLPLTGSATVEVMC